MTLRWLIAGYGMVTVVAIALYFHWPSYSYVAVSIVGLASAGAVVVGDAPSARGFLFGRPMTADAVPGWLAAQTVPA